LEVKDAQHADDLNNSYLIFPHNMDILTYVVLTNRDEKCL